MDTDTCLMRLEIVGLQETYVVCGNDGDTAAAGQRDGRGNITLFVRATEPLQLDVETIAEQLEPLIERLLRIPLLGVDDGPADVAFGCAGQRNQTRGGLIGEP